MNQKNESISKKSVKGGGVIKCSFFPKLKVAHIVLDVCVGRGWGGQERYGLFHDLTRFFWDASLTECRWSLTILKQIYRKQ